MAAPNLTARNFTTLPLGPGPTRGNLNTARREHTATLLPDGKVLVAGGLNGGSSLTSAELYDPASGSWTATGNLHHARFAHTATKLPNGKILVAGGLDGFPGGSVLSSAELYDPASGTWTDTGSLNTARVRHTATLLPNGKVLVAGGLIAAALLPARNCTTRRAGAGRTRAPSTPRAMVTRRRCCPTARCWWQGDMDVGVLSSAELYDPASGTWTNTGSLNTARVRHTATLLPNGKVLVAGGDTNGGSLSSAELYDPASGSWTATGSLNTARALSHGDVAAQRQGAGGRGI